MLNDEEIKKIAKDKIDGMSEKEKHDVVYFSDEEEKILSKVKNGGIHSLTPEQQKKFVSMYDKEFEKRYPGGAEMAFKEQGMFDEKFNRNDFKYFKKNGLKSKMYKNILLAVLANLGMVSAAVIGKQTGVDLSASYPVFSVLSGVFALNFGNNLVRYFKSKKLMDIYETKEFQEQEVNAEIYNQLLEEEKSKGRR